MHTAVKKGQHLLVQILLTPGTVNIDEMDKHMVQFSRRANAVAVELTLTLPSVDRSSRRNLFRRRANDKIVAGERS